MFGQVLLLLKNRKEMLEICWLNSHMFYLGIERIIASNYFIENTLHVYIRFIRLCCFEGCLMTQIAQLTILLKAFTRIVHVTFPDWRKCRLCRHGPPATSMFMYIHCCWLGSFFSTLQISWLARPRRSTGCSRVVLKLPWVAMFFPVSAGSFVLTSWLRL